MAFENNQEESALPVGSENEKRKTSDHLPKYFRTEFNNKFLNATLDQLLQPGVAEKLNAFYGRKTAKAFESTDNYVEDTSSQRENYQLESTALIKDNLGNINFYADYNDYINRISILNGTTTDHSILNSQEFYAWNPNLDWDKLVNYRDYYWLSTGPDSVFVYGQSKEIVSTYTIELQSNVDNNSYLFTPDGLTNNPTLKLFRGQTYRFEVNVPNYPIAFATKTSFIPGETVGSSASNTSLIYTEGITKFDEDGFVTTENFIDSGVIEFTIPDNAPDILYYISKDDPNLSGLLQINDILENTEIDVEKEIIGKKTYTTSSGWNLSNGFKLQFVGNVTPEKYASGEWYVEGVGDAIQLIKQEDLNVSGIFTDDIDVPFDGNGFDYYPFSEALGFPTDKDYIVINRGSVDGNLWSRYNRWFHKTVIEKTAEINGQVISVDQSLRATRPIIEFEKGLKLYKFGTKTKANVNLIDTVTVDVFSIIEGSVGYNIDGVDITEGMRILFTADQDVFVKGKIFKVKFVTINNNTQISLVEEEDSDPLINETVLITNGNQYRGKYFYYDGTNWQIGQEKTSINQPPMFDLFDQNDVSFSDTSIYESSQFAGNKVFSYEEGTGSNDSELGFPLQYRNIENTGDILFTFNLLNESFRYTVNNVLYTQNTDQGFLRKYNTRTSYVLKNGWEKSDKDSYQNVIRQYVYRNVNQFYIDMYDDLDFINKLWLRVYKNNILQKQDVDFEIKTDVNGYSYVEFLSTLNTNDVIIFKTRSEYPKNNNGYYEIPYNFEKNPLNNNINQFTLGEVNDHLATIVEELDNFEGTYPGTSNLRDLGNITKYGRKFLKHSSPLNLSLFHLLDDRSNVIKSLAFARYEYAKFKRFFIETASNLGFDGPEKIHLDKILFDVNKDKVNTMPFYFSDMVPFGGTNINSIEIEDTDQQFFALSEIFDINSPSTKAVQIYQNGKQLIYNRDYTFNNEGFVVVTAEKQIGDIIDIYEYESTNGSYVPPTPTKLGLYPKFVPEIYIDTTIQVLPPENPSGPYKIYGIADKNQVSAGELGWYYPVYVTMQEAKDRDVELGGSGQAHIHTFVGLNRPFYMPMSDANHAAQDDFQYDEWQEGSVIIQGHDGSKLVAFKDYRDNLILELEKRIYNNLKVTYDSSIFDINDFNPGLFRKTSISKSQIDKALISDFLSWSRLVDIEYTTHSYFDRKNRFTFNYSNSNYYNNEKLPGWWRQAFIYAYDTDRPHTHPWEMLGFSIKPDWWEEEYGVGPYTSNNLILWQDLEKGIVRQPSFQIKKKYIRPGLTNFLPVDKSGNLLSPNDARLAQNVNPEFISNSFNFGDGSPVESAWRRSSEFPFALLSSFILNKPSKVFASGFDRLRQTRNSINQLVYSETNKNIQLNSLVFPAKINDESIIFTSGLLNYIFDYQTSINSEIIDEYKSNIKNITNQISFKVGGFTEKSKFRLILDSRTPLNEGNVFVPDENYDIFFNTSFPIQEISYSGVVVEKQPEGYYIRGYDNQTPMFKYFKPVPRQKDPVITVGGASEPFVNWNEDKVYAQGTVVKVDQSYYRCTETHTSSNTFDADKFSLLPKLPFVGGETAIISKNYEFVVSELNYGSLLKTKQEVVNFLLGYGKYLENLGFTFSTFVDNNYEVSDWINVSKQFLYWTTQNWSAGSLLTLSPGAFKINYQNPNATVGNIFDTFYGYSILKADGKPLDSAFLKFAKDTDNNFSVRTINTDEGIYAIKIPIVTKEHVVVIDNNTVFGDVIYDIEPGYRQERIKVLGYRTSNWNGSFNIPGFIFDNAKITEWASWQDYAIGDIVKYKEFYYIAKNKITGTANFDSSLWNRLDEKPEQRLYPNFDYKINQFADFYDLDSDNFDTEQQKLAQHLIGYQKRKYLENIINDDVSQYKFYQGFIQEKGSKNALTKLFDALASFDKDSLEFYEEWAVKDGQYGASAGFEEVEYILDEKKFVLTPQPILLTNQVTGNETDLVYRIQSYETYLKPSNYTHNPFPTKVVDTTYTKDSGYVNSADVNYILGTYDELVSLNIENLTNKQYVWIGNVDFSWNVYQYVNSNYKIETIEQTATGFSVHLNYTPKDIQIGDIVGITDIQKIVLDPEDSSQTTTFEFLPLSGFFKITNIELNKLTFETEESVEDFENCTGILTKFKSVRATDLQHANRIAEHGIELGFKIWVDDNGEGKWTVIQNQSKFDLLTEISSIESNNSNFGHVVTVDKRNTYIAIGAPEDEDGKVYLFRRASESLNWQLSEILEPLPDAASPGQKFGYSVDFSTDGKYLIVGAPNASNVKTQYEGEYVEENDYAQGDIVSYAETFWQAFSDIKGAVDNIVFNSFGNYNQILFDIGLDEEDSEVFPLLLAGNYPFTNVTADHFLVRAPLNIYQGVGENDEIFLHWNKLTNANQTQTTLEEREPFNGTIPYLNKEYLESLPAHTVRYKIDAILYVDQTTVVPELGDLVNTQGAEAIVVYLFTQGGSTTIYVNNVNGSFPNENSLFIEGNDFIGEYSLVGPAEETTTSTKLGNYFFIQTSNPYTVGTINSDSGRGLLIKNVVPDSTITGRYYYNILDYATAAIDSENTDHSLIRTLSFQGFPGPGGSTDPVEAPYYVVRAPKSLTDTVNAGDEISMYFNNLKKTVAILEVTDPVSVVKGEILSQALTGATATVFETVTSSTQIKVQGITGSFNTLDFLSGSQSGDLLSRPFTVPESNILIEPTDIGLRYDITNRTKSIVDVWDGYINYTNIFFDTVLGEPFEPIARYRLEPSGWEDLGPGQTVRDVTTGATAEVMFYQRNLNDVTIFVKNVSGNWSKGDLFGDNAEIEMLAYPSGPDPDAFGRTGTYTTDVKLGQIQKVSLGYSPANIGKLLVFNANENIEVPDNDILKDQEYWLYTQGNVSGIPRQPNIPNTLNLDWIEIFKIPIDSTGIASAYTNEGAVYIYERFSGNYVLQTGVVAVDRKENNYFGNKVKLAFQNSVYRAYVLAADSEVIGSAGRIFFLKTGLENNNSYNWEYGKNKKFKGEFSELLSYYTGDIVYVQDGPDALGNLYTAITNLPPGSFDAQFWTSTDDLVDYVGYIPNDTGFKVIDDSALDSSIEQQNLYDFGVDFDVSDDGQVLITTVRYSDQPNIVAVYRLDNGFYAYSQSIKSPEASIDFGSSISINNDGTVITIGAPKDDTVKNDQGKVFIYVQQNREFVLQQTLLSPQNESAELFGNKVIIDENKIIVNAKNADNYNLTTFDNKQTTFDNQFTIFKYQIVDGGTVYIYEKVYNEYLYGHSIRYESDFSPNYYFGRNIAFKDNHIYVGVPDVSVNTLYKGAIIDYRSVSSLYTVISELKDTVDLEKIKRVILYNKKTKKLLKYLDYIDPLQGKVAGLAEENLRYKLYYDPAVYTNGNSNVILDPYNSWGKEQVGQLWWDLTNAKFYNPYQGDITFSANNWNQLFLSNTIDVYEWVESTYSPTEWDNIADTDQGITQGISGLSKYGANNYVLKKVFDEVSQSFSNLYYFWVKDKKIIPNVENRSLSSFNVAKLITDPKNEGYQFVGLFTSNSFAVYNCTNLLENKDVVLSVQYWTIDSKSVNIHNQYQIITEGLETSYPNRDIENKWIDSLVGYDLHGRIIPDPTLSEKEKYGVLTTPRQSWFVNRVEALKQYIERVNRVLQTQLVVDSKNLSNLEQQEEYPLAVSRLYDTVVDTLADLNQLGVAKAQQAEVQLVIEDGVVVDVIVINAGRGYLVVPTYTVSGKGEGLEISFTINNVGSITSASIINGGKNYTSATIITIRRFSVLVLNDETIQGKWAIYERDTVNLLWSRFRSQAYNTNLYWNYIDWYASGYGIFTEIDFVVDFTYELSSIDDNIGNIVKINNVGTGGWLLLRKIDDQLNVDYTVNYETIGRQNGTIKFSNTLYDTGISFDGFDEISFDTKFYDSLPSTETRIIANAIKNDLFVNDLAIEYNNLFFASLKYVFYEQKYVDWVFKTSFIKAKHNVGELRKDITFNNDNLPSYQEYINEVKPFKTSLREFVSSYEKLENSSSVISDFDVPPRYNEETQNIEPISIPIQNDRIPNIEELDQYPNKIWKDTAGFEIVDIQIADGGKGYQSPPQITLSGGGGSGAKAITKLGANGKITKVEITNPGSGYLSAPTLFLNGSIAEGGYEARLSVILGKSLARGIQTKIKFDRLPDNFVSFKSLYNDLNEVETFTGTGSKYIFDLKWPMDLKSTNVEVLVNNRILLTSELTYENKLDTSKSYNRYKGRIILTTPAANGSSVVISYKKDIGLLSAVDRINFAYDPQTGMLANDLSQLLDGVDYGGVEVKSFDFGKPSGWDTAPWYTGSFDTYDTTFNDEIITLDGSTVTLQLSQAFENGVVYNVYQNGVRIDDPNYGTLDPVTNPNALMQSITGDGVTDVIELQDLGISTAINDVIIVRKTTSDGSFLPTDINYDTLLGGGDLNYSNATGLNAEDINVDGDSFFSITNSKGTEEFVPGHVLDTLDIKVYERPSTGASQIISNNYQGDGSTKNFYIGTKPNTELSLFVKVDGIIKKLDEDYTINYTTSNVEFVSAPASNTKINLLTLGYSGSDILDIDTFIGDGSTINFLTNIRWSNDLSAQVTINGKEQDYVLIQSDETYISPNNIVIKFAQPPEQDTVIHYAIFKGTVQNYSTVTIDTFVSDGSTTFYTLTQPPFNQSPEEWFTIVKINDEILNSGYYETFSVSDVREYTLRLYQVPLASINSEQLRVYLNNTEIFFPEQWTFNSAEAFDPLLPLDKQSGSTIILADNIGFDGDILKVYITGWDDSSLSGGDYRYGYFDEDNNYVQTPGQLYINKNYNLDDIITVYQFSNHDSQGIERQSFDVVERTELSQGILAGTQQYQLDDSTAEINLTSALAIGKQYSVYLNNVRIDDPNYGTSDPVTNPNAILQTIVGDGTNILRLDDLGITTNVGDVIKLNELNAVIIRDTTTSTWYEFRQLKNGYIPLTSPAVDDQYVWVVKNGVLLSPSVDYYVTADKMRVKVLAGLQENDNVQTIHFSNELLKNKYGWRQFKDILNRNHYKLLDGTKNIKLVEDLNWYDKVIHLENADSLPVPDINSRNPGVIFIEGERIEYFIKDGNYLKQLRRGTLGTGVKNIYLTGTEIYNQSADKTLPYKDETLSTIFTADGTSAVYDLDFTPTSINDFEVFVAGRRLRKTEMQSYQLDTELRYTYGTVDETIQLDSPEGDITLPAEFSIENSNQLVLLDTPLENQKVIVIRRQGKLWTNPGTPLSQSNTDISRFLQSTQVDLPR